ncbi:MAG: TolC family protein [Deltaproteobacteria bacterium]|nr:TolC family protein [Deltaproteobacteria bacterium]
MSKPTSLAGALVAMLVVVTAAAREPSRGRLTEREALALAAEKNPSLRAALAQLRDAARTVQGEQSRYPWTLGLDGGATRSASPRLIQGQNVVGEIYTVDANAELQRRLRWGTDLTFSLRSVWQNSVTPASLQFIGVAPNGAIPTIAFSARASINQPLLRGAGAEVTLAPLEVARGQQTQAGRAAERVASAVVRDVRLAYWDLWYAEEALRIQARSRDVAVEQRDQALMRVKTGSLAPADALAFETRLATREEELSLARVEVERTEVTLAGRIGALGGRDPLGAPGDVPPDLPPAPDATTEEREALAVSPELGDLRAALEVAKLQRRTAGDANRPRLDASAFLQLDGLGSADAGAALEQLATLGAWSAYAGLSFDAPLDGGRRTADIGRANAAIELAEARLEERRQLLLTELRTAAAREEGARRRLTLGEATAERARQQLDAETQRYATGSSTPLLVLQAEDDLRNARLRVARARLDVLGQAIVREHLAGRLLARHAELFDAQLGASEARIRGVFEAAAY